MSKVKVENDVITIGSGVPEVSGKVLKTTLSVCPQCFKVIPAVVYEKDNVVYIAKYCPEHGKFEDVYWSDAELYKQFAEYDMPEYIGTGLENPRTKVEKGCPFDCGICPNHKSYTILAIIDVTNRCNMRCPVCFAHAGAKGYVYEPSYEEIVKMLKNLRENRPWPANALQFSGGEPTVRNDLPELVKAAKKLGFRWVCIDTNGIRFAEDIEFFRKCVEAGTSSIYLQFDGLTPDVYAKTRGSYPYPPEKLLEIKFKVIENARKVGMDSIVLVVTLVKGVNDHQLGDIIRFAAKNSDVVRCVNVQPVSFAGRAAFWSLEEKKKHRITIADFIKLVAKQTNYEIRPEDFRPTNWPVKFVRAINKLTGKHYPLFSMNPFCGAATFVLPYKGDDGEYHVVPVTRIAKVDEFVAELENIVDRYFTDISKIVREYKTLLHREASIPSKIAAIAKAVVKLDVVKMYRLKKNIEAELKDAVEKYVNDPTLRDRLLEVIEKHSYEALGRFMRRVIMIGGMHFMDVSNFDLDRVQRCVIHYATPDGKIIPFCTYNNFHRDEFEKRFSISLEEWMKKTGKKPEEYA